MLEKPNIADEFIVSQLQKEYDLHAATLTFLPIGADEGSAVYRIVTDDGTTYFLKLRKGFNEIVVSVPLFLESQGIREIIIPFETRSKQGWADFGEYKMILYPFIEGKNGFEMELTDDLKRRFGSALRAIHSTKLPPELERHIPREAFTNEWRNRLRSLQARAEEMSFPDSAAAKLDSFIRSNRREIDRLIQRTEKLASQVQSRPLELVLCHTDIHGGNILLRRDGQPPNGDASRLPAPTNQLYIIDWDAPLLAPKERDLMFIGGGIDPIWNSKRDEAIFHEGYGNTHVDLAMLAYYRYERVIEDLVAYGEQLLLTDEGGADRERAYERFIGNFEPGQTIEIAQNTDPEINEDHD